MINPSTLKIMGIFTVVGLCTLSMPSRAAYTEAGFQWVVPSDAPNVQPAPVIPVPRGNFNPSVGAPEVISPVVIEGQRDVSEPSPVTNHAPLRQGSAGSEMLSSSARPGVERPEAPTVASTSEVVQGFAKQVPLAVALRQLLPPGYGFSVDQNVDLGTLVSFQGGQTWRDTLRTALEPASLVMREQGQMVTINRADQAVVVDDNLHPARETLSSASMPMKGDRVVQPASGVTEAITMPASEAGAGPVVQSWSAERGDTLRKILEEWSRRANIEFDWKSEYDYPLQASVAFSGTFEDAVRNLLTGFELAHPQPVAELHANSNLGQMVLVVSTRGNNYSN